MRSLLQGLQRSLPKPCLFGLYGASAGSFGALLMGELLWFVLSPALAAGGPSLQLAASDPVSVYQGGQNRCMVTLGRSDFDGEVKVQLVSPPAGIDAPSITIPKGKSEGQLDVGVGPDVDLGARKLTVRTTGEGRARGRGDLRAEGPQGRSGPAHRRLPRRHRVPGREVEPLHRAALRATGSAGPSR